MFIRPCDVRIKKGGLVTLIQPLIFLHRGVEITLHIGFTWNLANIPRAVWALLGNPLMYIMESALHDALYATGLFSREESDLYWYVALRSGGEFKDPVSKPLAKTLHAGVRVGGAPYYKQGSIADAREFVSIRVL